MVSWPNGSRALVKERKELKVPRRLSCTMSRLEYGAARSSVQRAVAAASRVAICNQFTNHSTPEIGKKQRRKDCGSVNSPRAKLQGFRRLCRPATTARHPTSFETPVPMRLNGIRLPIAMRREDRFDWCGCTEPLRFPLVADWTTSCSLAFPSRAASPSDTDLKDVDFKALLDPRATPFAESRLAAYGLLCSSRLILMKTFCLDIGLSAIARLSNFMQLLLRVRNATFRDTNFLCRRLNNDWRGIALTVQDGHNR